MKKHMKAGLILIILSVLCLIGTFLAFFIMHHTYDAPESFYATAKIAGIMLAISGGLAFMGGIILCVLPKHKEGGMIHEA